MTSQQSSRSAAAKPRVELRPPCVDSLGWAACELIERAGKPLDAWQADALDLMCSIREDGTWACTDYCEWVARQNGKGAILEARALAGMFLFGEAMIVWSAHEVKTALEAFRRMKTLILALGWLPNPLDPNLIEVDLGGDQTCLVKVTNTNGREGFERLDTEQRILFVARSKGSARGFTAGVQIIDESFAYTAAQQDALAPTTLAVENEQTIYTSTPPLDGMSGEVMYTLRKRADDGGDDSLGYRDWGLGGWLEELDGVPADEVTGTPEIPAVDVDDRALWRCAVPALGHRITELKLERLRRKLGRPRFAKEILGVWPRPARTGGGDVDMRLWEQRADPDSRPAGDGLVFAIDASPRGRTAAIGSGGRREDGRLHTKIVDYRPGTGWVVPRIVELVARYKPSVLVLDPSGPAGALLGDLQAAVMPDGGRKLLSVVELALVSGREMAQACGALMADMREDRWRHCGQEALDVAAEQATTRPLSDAWAWDRRDSAGDICPLVTVTLAAHGFRVHGVRTERVPMAAWV